MLFLTGAKDVLALCIVVLAHAVVAIGLLVVAGVPVLHREVWLAELGRAIAELWEVTLVGACPTLGAPRKELRRERGEGKLHQETGTSQQSLALHLTHSMPQTRD